MRIYWLALDKNDNYTSYEEIKHRKEIAIGWRDLGDLTTLARQNVIKGEKSFKKIIIILGEIAYKKKKWWIVTDQKYVPQIIWKFFNIKKGDIIIAVEGTRVKGFCRVDDNMILQYQWQGCYEYAHCIASCVEWVDWNKLKTDFVPTVPAKGIKGIKNLKKERKRVCQEISKYYGTKVC